LAFSRLQASARSQDRVNHAAAHVATPLARQWAMQGARGGFVAIGDADAPRRIVQIRAE
jgi:hypothetical protein